MNEHNVQSSDEKIFQYLLAKELANKENLKKISDIAKYQSIKNTTIKIGIGAAALVAGYVIYDYFTND